jgi:3-hydroxyacyl-CoA dehydrogenase
LASRHGRSPKTIVERCILALVNEGARILDERIAQRASDIDLVYPDGLRSSAIAAAPCSTPTCWVVATSRSMAHLRPMRTPIRRSGSRRRCWPSLAEGKTFNG